MNLALFAWRVPRSKLEEYQKMFTFFDANNDGHITFHELKMAMNRCGLYPNQLEMRILLGLGDKDGNGIINFDEFLELMLALENQKKEQQPGASIAEQQDCVGGIENLFRRPSSALNNREKVTDELALTVGRKSVSLKNRLSFRRKSMGNNAAMNPLISALVAAGQQRFASDVDNEQTPLLFGMLPSPPAAAKAASEDEHRSNKSDERRQMLRHLSPGYRCGMLLKQENREELAKEFKLFDKDNDGYIEPCEMEALVDELRLNGLFPRETLRELFYEVDTNRDGRISFEEFVAAMGKK